MTDTPAQEAAEYFRKADIVERRSDSASGYGNFHYVHSATIRRALRLLAAVEAGTHKVVPVEPSDKMADAGGHAFMEGCYEHLPGDLKNSNRPFKCYYRAMLQAAPDFFETKPPAET